MRRAVVVVLIALTVGCSGSAETSPTVAGPASNAVAAQVDESMLNDMILHLPDAPVGARIGDDSYCPGGFSSEGDTNAFLDLVAEARGTMFGCFIQLEAPEVFTYSLVVLFPNEDLAARAMQTNAFERLAAYFSLDCCNGQPIGPFRDSDELSGEGLQAESDRDTSAIVGWRNGSLVGAIAVHRIDRTPGALADANRLAAVQNQRMLTPVPVAAEVDDDRLVGLQVAPFRTWWLGATFAPQGARPSTLYSTRYGQSLVELDYDGIRIEIFDLNTLNETSTPGQILDIAAELFDSPCTVEVPVDVAEGEATLLGRFVPLELLSDPPIPGRTSWGPLTDGTCPVGEPNVWIATVEHEDGLLLRVNAPLCYSCLVLPDPELPYRTADGLKVVLGSLTPYTD